MNKLKFSCPFGGKTYPAYIVGAIVCIAPMMALANGQFISGMIGTIFLVLVVLGISFWMEHRLDDAEQELVDHIEAPLWENAPPELLESIRKRTHRLSSTDIAALVLLVAMLMCLPFYSVMPGSDRAGFFFMLIGSLAVLFFSFLRGAMWRTVDETAMFILVPVHHTYSVTHHSKYSTYEEYYHVLYLPEGRFILHAKPEDADAVYVNIVKYRGMITWLPYRAPLGNNSGDAYRVISRVDLRK